MDQDLQQAQQDVTNFLNGTTTGADAQARAQAAQQYINWATKPVPQTETSSEKEARQLQVQNARQAWQASQNAQNQASSLQRAQLRADTSTANQTARDATSVQTTGMRDDTSAANTAARDATSVQTTGMRDDTSRANNADTNATRVDVANINVAGRLAEIEQQRVTELAKVDESFKQQSDLARQRYNQTKDLQAYEFEQRDINNQHLQQAMQVRQMAEEAQKEAYNLPKQQADIATEQARARTEQQQADTAQRQQEQQARYQSANLQLSVAKDQSDQAKSAIDSGVKLGVAPPMELVKAQFAPFQMAQEVLKQLVDAGQIDHTRVPEALGINPTNGIEGGLPLGGGAEQDNARLAAQSAPPPLGQFSGYGTPGGYQGAPNPNIFGGAPEPGA